MKRHFFALTTGAALVASLLVGGAVQAQTDTPQGTPPAAGSGTSRNQILVRAESHAPAAADVPVTAPDGVEPVDALAQPATPNSGQAAVTSASDAAGVSRADAPKDADGQVALAMEPSDLSQAPTATDANGQVELAAEPGTTSTTVDSQ